MWVTQTYLGTVEPDAKLFVYYLYEDHDSHQKEFTKSVQRYLEELGEVYGEDVSLMMPNPRYSGRIEAEVRDLPKLWKLVRDMLPGLLLSPQPLTKLATSLKNCKYIPFDNGNPKDVARVIQNVRGIANKAVSESRSESPAEAKSSLLSRFVDAIEVKPGIWGVNLDLKRLAAMPLR